MAVTLVQDYAFKNGKLNVPVNLTCSTIDTKPLVDGNGNPWPEMSTITVANKTSKTTASIWWWNVDEWIEY